MMEAKAATSDYTAEAGSFMSLLFQLTVEEKVTLLAGSSFSSMSGVPRLGIPALKVSDSINGVRGTSSHIEAAKTACFPSTTCLASTWNHALMRRFGERVGAEARHKAVQVVLGPTINMHRDPRGGRNFESFSEDPLLTGELSAAIVNGINAAGVGACVKHFVGNESETLRSQYNLAEAQGSRTLREIYLRAFQVLLRNSDPESIMLAYNKVDGVHCSETPLMKNVLRDEWQYRGCMMSDWFATRSTEAALKAGLDIEMPGPSMYRGAKLVDAARQGTVSEDDIDAAVLNVLRMIDRTKASHSSAAEVSPVTKETCDMAREAALEGIVLLKNDASVLPLDFAANPKIAVIGDAAANAIVTGGGSAYSNPQYRHSPLDKICSKHSSPESVVHARGVNPAYLTPPAPIDILATPSGEPGVQVEWFNNGGSEAAVSPLWTDVLSQPPAVAMIGYYRPPLNPATGFYFILTTCLTPKTSGVHKLGCQVTSAFTLSVDGAEVLSGASRELSIEDFLFVPKRLESIVAIHMEAGKSYTIRLVVQSRVLLPDAGEPPCNAAKICFEEYYDDERAIADAAAVARDADVTIVYGGRTHEHESEGFDMDGIKLAPLQERMLVAVGSAAKKAVLVLHGGNPIDVSGFVEHFDAILFAHFPGQEGAQAVADILSGAANPSGKLATSWPYELEKVPTFGAFPAALNAQGREPTMKYDEGTKLGYRHPAARDIYRYPFGFGLSYSQFAYSRLTADLGGSEVSYAEQTVTVKVVVENKSAIAGQEVVQIYSSPPSGDGKSGSEEWRPARELIGFTKVHVDANASAEAQIVVAKRDIASIWSPSKDAWRTIPGDYTLTAGDCSTVIHLADSEIWRGL
ncbi:beta-glucosidase [Microdochium nivale]|nr:beta-glucosidase [Microdochium nivale]